MADDAAGVAPGDSAPSQIGFAAGRAGTLVPPALPHRALGWRGLLLALAIIWGFAVCSQLLAGAIVGIVAAINDSDPLEMFMQPALIAPLSILGSIVAVTVGWYFACARTGASLAEGLAVRPAPLRGFVLGGSLGFVAALAISLVASSVEESKSLMSELVAVDTGDGNAPRPSLIMMAFAVIMPPFEELYYRGFLYTAFRRLASVWVAFPLICIWFGSIHAFQLAGDWVFLGFVVLMGIAWTGLRERYGSMLVSLASHWIYNGTLVATAYAVWAFSS